MKQNLITTTLGYTAKLALLIVAASSLNAQTTNQVIITATATVQNPNSSDNGISTTTPTPSTLTLNTKQILAFLALDENSEGNYPQTNFPKGVKLISLPDSGNGPDFQVWDKSNNLLVDVSDILTYSNTGTYGAVVSSGKVNDNSQLSSPSTTNQQIVTITYDDSAAGGNLKFSLSGVGTDIITDTAVKHSTSRYTQTESFSATGMSGDGNYTDTNGNINPFVITGEVSASGSAIFSQ